MKTCKKRQIGLVALKFGLKSATKASKNPCGYLSTAAFSPVCDEFYLQRNHFLIVNTPYSMVKKLQGKIFGDRGYISGESFQKLWEKSVQLITGIRKNMKNHLMSLFDKLLSGIRDLSSITIFDKLKSQMGIEHSRHRSPVNASQPCLVLFDCPQPGSK